MINVIYSEFLKLKKSSYMLLILASALTMPIIMNIAILIVQDKNRTFDSYAYNIEQISCLLIYGIVFCIISGYVFSREYSHKTASTLYSYPCSRIKIFIGKLFVIYATISLIYLIQCIAIYIGYYKLFGFIEREALINDIKANLCSLLCQMMIIPIPILLAIFKKNIIIPVAYGIVQLCVTGVFGDNYKGYFPMLLPYVILRRFYVNDEISINHIMISAFICFVVFVSLALYEHDKADIL